MLSSPASRPWRNQLCIFASALAAVVPLALRGTSCGHDFDFHLQSWLAVADQWHRGVFYPHWLEASNYGAGEPRLIFYPPFTWMLGALLGMILPWKAVPLVFTFLLLAASGLTMRRLASDWLALTSPFRDEAAIIAACAYMLSPYTLFVAYERTAYGELAASIWLPLLVLSAWRLEEAANPSSSRLRRFAQDDKVGEVWHPAQDSGAFLGTQPVEKPRSQKRAIGHPHLFRNRRRNIAALALVVAAVWLTNAPAAVMSCYLLAAIVLSHSIRTHHWRPVLDSAISLLLGLGLASFYLVPAAYERRWVEIARAIGPGMRVQDSFLFGRTGESFHDHVLHTASWIFVAMLAAIAGSALLAWRKNLLRKAFPAFAGALVVLLFLQTPWSQLVWGRAPELRFLQFPWRWTLVLSLIFALSIAAATLNPAPAKSARNAIARLAICGLAMISIGAWLFWQPCDEEDAVSAQLALFQAGPGFPGTDEYTSLGADNSIIQQGLPQIRVMANAEAETASAPAEDQENPAYQASSAEELQVKSAIERWQPERKHVTIENSKPGFVVLRLMDYPAWQVLLNQTTVAQRPHRDDGLLTIPIPPGINRIDIQYRATPDVWCGRLLSIASLLMLLALWLGGRRPANLGYYD